MDSNVLTLENHLMYHNSGIAQMAPNHVNCGKLGTSSRSPCLHPSLKHPGIAPMGVSSSPAHQYQTTNQPNCTHQSHLCACTNHVPVSQSGNHQPSWMNRGRTRFAGVMLVSWNAARSAGDLRFRRGRFAMSCARIKTPTRA